MTGGGGDLDGIIGEFLAESLEGLDRADQDFVALERNPGDTDLLADVFRVFHTIKGSCGFLEFPKLEVLAHAGESLLGDLRDGSLTLDSDIASTLLATVDAIRSALDRIGQGGVEGDDPAPALIARLEALRTGERGRGVDAEGDADGDTTRPDLATFRTALLALDEAFEGDEAALPLAEAFHRLEKAAEEAGLWRLAVLSARAAEGVETDGALDVLLDVAALSAEALATFDATGHAIEPDVEGLEARLRGLVPGAAPAAAASASAPPASPPPSPEPASPAPSAGDDAFQRANAGESTIRVDVGLLDQLMNQVGELVLSRNQIIQHLLGRGDKALAGMAQRLSQITTDLQESIMLTRLQPIRTVWNRFPRMVRDLALELGKSVELVMQGTDTELDRTLLEAIRGPMTHLVRNAIDHGIEGETARRAAGKSAAGTLTLKAWHEGGQVNIEIADDGKGIDVDRIAEGALAKGLVSAEQVRAMSAREKMDLIFLPGFSTAERVTHVSGRGVGMDVVKNNIDRINGVIDVASRPGLGTTVRLKIPLTLAIVPALVVECCGERYAIPQVSLLAVVRLTLEEAERGIEELHDVRVYRWRDTLIPILSLREQLKVERDRPLPASAVRSIVVLQAEGHVFGLIVEHVLDSGEIVVKPLGRALSRVPLYAGATIMGDGRAAMILDVLGLAEAASILGRNGDRGAAREASDLEALPAVSDAPSMLLVRIGRERVAVPLSDAIRLERFPASALEGMAGRTLVQYRGGVLPLRRLDAGEAFVLDPGDRLHVVVHTDERGPAGLLVDELLDIVATRCEVQPPTVDAVGLVGTTVIGGDVAHVLDIERIVRPTRESA